jgi:hypothetical protein
MKSASVFTDAGTIGPTVSDSDVAQMVLTAMKSRSGS